MLTFVSARRFCTSCKAWFQWCVRAGADIGAINYETNVKMKQKFSTVTKSSFFPTEVFPSLVLPGNMIVSPHLDIHF